MHVGGDQMALDFNVLGRIAEKAMREGRHSDALRIYLFMSDGDPSLDAGYLGEKIGECYEAEGDIPAARYWYGRAVEENPEVRQASVAAKLRLGQESYEELVSLG
jgi:tetratricopeptide (TPR) repeat protein